MPADNPDILYFNTWYRGHNNPRYSELLPRLARVRPYLLTFPRPRLVRGVTDRAWRLSRRVLEPATFSMLQRRHPYAFVNDVRQLPYIRVPAFVDIDDFDFSAKSAALLRQSTAVGYTTTAESAARRIEELGVDLPWEIIPQGAAVDRLDPQEVAELRHDGPVVGYVAAFLLLPGDRGGTNPLYDVTHLLDLWDAIVERVPDAQLWLAGGATARLRRRVANRPDIRLFGRVDRRRVFSLLANVDVAVYPRHVDQGIRAAKIAEYLAVGLPIVAYDHLVVDDVRKAGAGKLASNPAEFADAVATLLTDDAERARLAAAAAAEGAKRDWRLLAAQYSALLDRALPRLD
ncbi:MAG TPA: glycosyltransferase [Gaiellaceae bacterium]